MSFMRILFYKYAGFAAALCLFSSALVAPPVFGAVSLADLEKISASGTPGELEAALSEISADAVFPSGNRPLHTAAEFAKDPDVIKILAEHGASLSAEGLERLTPLMLAAAYNPDPSITEALINAAQAENEAGGAINAADRQGRTPLHLAAATNGSGVVKILLSRGALPNVRDRSGKTPLWVAANRSDAAAVKLLLDAGAKAEEPNDDGVTPLLAASEKPDAAVLRFLAEAGADVNVRGKNRYTPLMSALAAGADAEAVKALTDGGADVNAEDDGNRSALHLLASRAAKNQTENAETGKIIPALVAAGANPDAMDAALITPLMEACKHKNYAAAEALLASGARVDLRDRGSWTALLHAASKGAPLEIYELLKKFGADIDVSTRKGTSPLMEAVNAKTGLPGIRALLDAGANPNYRGYDTISVLMSAVAAYDADMVKLLLEYGADPNLATWDGLSPLMLASQRAQEKAIFDALGAGGAEADSKSSQGITALMVAVTSGNIVAAESLIALSADLEARDMDGMTAITHAVLSSEDNEDAIDIIDLLIESGCDVNARDFTGAVPLMHAALNGRHDIAAQLLEAGARLDAADTVGWTPLHFAARSASGEEVTELFIEQMARRGKSVDVPDNGGTTPVMVAASYNNTVQLVLLMEAGASFERRDKTGRSAYEYADMKNAAQSVELLKEWNPHK